MYYKKNLDFAALIWEDLAYQIDNKESKKQDKMYYPRFTKAIIHHFLIKDKSISMRNRTFMHTARDDSMLGTMRFTYYAIATGAESLKPKKTQKKSDSAISFEETPSKEKPAKAKKVVSPTKKPTTKPKPTKKKAPVKADRGKVPDEQQRKISGIDKGTGTKPGVPDVPKYDSESEKESWGNSREEDDDDEDDYEDESDDDKNYELTDEEDNANNAKEENEEEKDDVEELYKDVNVNLRKEDIEMTDVDQGVETTKIKIKTRPLDQTEGRKEGSKARKLSHIEIQDQRKLNIINPTQEILVGPAFNLLKGTCKSRTELEYHFEECYKASTDQLDWHNPEGKQYPFDLFTSLKIMKWYDYGHLDEIEVRREDQQLYKFKEGDFPRLHLQDIEDMLLLLVQQKLTNLTIDERYDLNVALRMFTRRIFIQRLVEDLQLGVESYQKKLNLTKLDTFRPDLRNRTAFTRYSDPQGVIYMDQNNRNRLMLTDELHKFSDGTLNYVWTALHDITSGIRMEYLPKKKWSRLDK
ncbi:hypothetical protein Tco_0558374 [Tanacetum coccineum]